MKREASYTLKNIALTILTIVFLSLFIYGLGNALVPLVLAGIFAYLVYPLLTILEKNNISKRVSVSIIILILMVLFLLLTLVVLPIFLRDFQALLINIPDYSKSLFNYIQRIAQNYDIPIYWDANALVMYLKTYVQSISLQTIQTITNLLQNTLTTIIGILLFFMNLFLFPLFFYYVTTDYHGYKGFFESLIPNQYKKTIYYYLKQYHRIFSGYIRGQMIVVFIEMILYAIGLHIIGLSFGVLIGLMTGLLTIIPYAGPFIGYSTCIIVMLATDPSWPLFFQVTILFGIIITLENFIFIPYIVGDKVGLDPLFSIIALVIFGNYFGILGILLGIPLGAIVKFTVLQIASNLQQKKISS